MKICITARIVERIKLLFDSVLGIYMYEFVDQSICKELRIECEKILKEVQSRVKEYFTFQFSLIGSGERRLVTRNGGGPFDLDYNLILMKDKQGLINNPKRIKDIFLNAFKEVNRSYGFSFAKNSTSVITSNLVFNKKVEFSFDCAIMCVGNNGNLYKIVFDKPDRYIWNEIKHTKEFNSKYQYLVSCGLFLEIKELYLKKKNMHLRRNDDISSFSILSETVNELFQKNY